MRNFYKSLFALIILGGLFSCEKDNNPFIKPKPYVPDTVLTESKFAGKWEAVRREQYYAYAIDSSVNSQWWVKDTGYLENGHGPIGRFWNDDDISYLEFKGDHTYSQYDIHNQSPSYVLSEVFKNTGTWSFSPAQGVEPAKLVASTGWYTYDISWTVVYYQDNYMQLHYRETDTADNIFTNDIVFHKLE